MRKFSFTFSIVAFLILGIFLGFSISDKEPKDKNPRDSRRQESTLKEDVLKRLEPQTDNNGIPNQIYGTPYYVDNFNGANDTNALKARGYKVYYRGSGPQGLAATWFQGNSAVFVAFNGPPTGYVAANFQVVTATNNIDSWLVLPKKSVASGDSIVFRSRDAEDQVPPPTFPDSIRVMYSAAGDSVPEAGSWVELGRFEVNVLGDWERKAFGAPSAGANARYAIRYTVVGGGPSGANSDYIGIDALTLESPPIANDVGTLSIDAPSASVSLPVPTIAPKATFINYGTANQTNVPVTYKITGPVNYTSNKSIATLNAGATQQVIFDSTFNPTPGTYNVTVYTSLASDGNRLNDTLTSTITATNINFGSGASYFFANSTPGASGAPSQPEFCWKDTTGSRSLIVNNVVVDSAGGKFIGNSDDGYFKIGNVLGLNKKIRFGGIEYDSVFIGTNGIIGFTNNTAFTSFSPAQGSALKPAFFPLWTDLFYPSTVVTENRRISYKVVQGFQLIVTYDRAPIFSATLPTDYVSFQAVIDIVDAGLGGNSRMLVQYSDALTGTGSGFYNKYLGNTLQTHLVGLQTAASQELDYRFSTGGGAPPAVGGPLFNTSPVAVQFGPNANTLNNRCGTATLTVKVCLEAISPTPDSITVQLRNPIDLDVVDASKVLLSLSGQGTFSYTKTANGQPYYIAVVHRNSIRTWSAVTISFSGGVANYDFTLGQSQAFGNNMTPSACIFTGDVDQNGFVDVSDLSRVYNLQKSSGGSSVGYVPEDLNYDDVCDVTDISFCFNNLKLGVIEISPP